MNRQFIKVTKKRFTTFIRTYPSTLNKDVAGFFDPPLITYNDFSLGDWPDSIVAKHSFSDLMGTKPNDFYIIDSTGKEELQ